ncbi:MAG: rhomboid family intramembrane serine protease [Candidatus Schekmanbacteria bacterium]|nr:rhomboid family intramembrane serine protease [Candidatus Schekmanbacteria bacterium]
MILIPIGLDNASVRRMPWVTIALMSLNVLAFVVLAAMRSGVERGLLSQQREIVAYWQRHPEVELPDDVARYLPRGAFANAPSRSAAAPSAGSAQGTAGDERVLAEMIRNYRDKLSRHPFQHLGFVPARPSPMAIITSMFVHGGLLHLLGNLLFFYITAPFLEDAYGRAAFAVLYGTAGIGGLLLHWLAYADSEIPLVGASGAIAGLMGAFAVRFARRRLKMLYWIFLFFRGTFFAPAWIVFPVWGVLELLSALLIGTQSGVGHLVHVGGFAVGLGGAYALQATKFEEKYVAPVAIAAADWQVNPVVTEARFLLESGRPDRARQILNAALAVTPADLDVHHALWDAYVRLGEANDGAKHLQKVIEHELSSGSIDVAVELWRELSAATGNDGPPVLRWRLASALLESAPTFSRDLLRRLAADSEAGPLAAKAAGKLAALAADEGERAHWSRVAEDARGDPVIAALPPSEAVSGPPPFPREIKELTVSAVRPDGLVILDESGASGLLRYARVEAVAGGIVTDAAPPRVVVDLVLNWRERHIGRALRIVRLDGCRINARALLDRLDLTPLQAFRALVEQVASQADAVVLPRALDGEGGLPMYEDVGELEGDAYVDRPAGSA